MMQDTLEDNKEANIKLCFVSIQCGRASHECYQHHRSYLPNVCEFQESLKLPLKIRAIIITTCLIYPFGEILVGQLSDSR